MALIGNHSFQNRIIARQFMGGANSVVQHGIPETFAAFGSFHNRYAGGFNPKSSTPNGHSHPMAWVMPQSSGGLAAYGLSGNISGTNALLARGLNLTAPLSASINTVQAALALIVSLEAALSASGQLTDANMAIIIQMQASLTATGTITTGLLGNIVNMSASLAAQGLLTDVDITNLINLSANITSQTELSPEALARSVWNALIADFQEPGSTGEALQNAGAGGNPWDALLSANNDPGTFGERVQKLLTVAKFLGLK